MMSRSIGISASSFRMGAALAVAVTLALGGMQIASAQQQQRTQAPRSGFVKKILVVGAVAAPLVAFGGSFVNNWGTHNTNYNAVKREFSQIDVSLQQRHDEIPNLARIAEKYAKHEHSTMTQVAALRSGLTEAKSATTPEKRIEAENKISAAITQLIPLQEKYPELKADVQFTTVSARLGKIEDRLRVTRTRYNDAATAYNTQVGAPVMPKISASLLGYKEAALFKADDAARTAPVLFPEETK